MKGGFDGFDGGGGDASPFDREERFQSQFGPRPDRQARMEEDMTLMDDFKRRTEDGLKTLKETAEGIAFNVEKQAKIARRRMDVMKIQKKIQKMYAEVGEYVYGEYFTERPISMESPFLKDRMTAISQMKVEVRDIEVEVEEVRGTQPPNHQEPMGPGDETA